jgi:hypothetical protein
VPPFLDIFPSFKPFVVNDDKAKYIFQKVKLTHS